MPTVRTIVWNINNFKGSTWTKHHNTIMDRVYNHGNRQVDLFVVVEPYSKMKDFGLGANVVRGAGLDGVLKFYFALAARDLQWKVVPLRTTANPPTSDMIALFYHSGVIDLAGPDYLDGGVTGVTTPPPAGFALPWDASSTAWPQVRFYEGGGAEINFYGRRPSLYYLAAPDMAEQDFAMDVEPQAGGAVNIVTDLLVNGAQNVQYEQLLQADGGTPPYNWAIGPTTNLGSLVFDPTTQMLSGTPTANGMFSLEVQVEDSAHPPSSATKTFNFNVAAPDPTLTFETASPLPKVLHNAPCRLRIAAQGGLGALKQSHSPATLADALPAGTTISADGVLSGTPIAAGPTAFHLSVRSEAYAERTFQLNVTAAGPFMAIHTTSLPDGRVGSPYNFRLQGTGGVGAKTWTQNPATNLVAGLAFQPATGVLSGTPTATGHCALDVTLSDGATTVNRVLNFYVSENSEQLAHATQGMLPPAALNEPYVCQLAGGGGQGSVSFALFGDLPAGLGLSTDGTISGTPTAPVANHQVDVLACDTGRAFKLLALHAPPQGRHPKNRDSVRNIAEIREITSAIGGFPVAVCGDFNVCTVPAQDCGTHKVGEVTALDPLKTAGYVMQNNNQRSSCKSSGRAQKDVYARVKIPPNESRLEEIAGHAFDHLLTMGIAAVNNCHTVNLVFDDPGYATARDQAAGNGPPPHGPSPIKGIVKKYIWSTGVSDHLPVRFDLVL